MFSMRLDTLHKVLYNFLINFIAKHRIVLQSQTHILKICKVVIFMQISLFANCTWNMAHIDLASSWPWFMKSSKCL